MYNIKYKKGEGIEGNFLCNLCKNKEGGYHKTIKKIKKHKGRRPILHV